MNDNFYTDVRARISERGPSLNPVCKHNDGNNNRKKERNKRWRERNAEYCLEYARQYRKDHAEQVKAYKEKFKLNGQRKKHDAKYRERHREQRNEYNRKYRARMKIKKENEMNNKNDFLKTEFENITREYKHACEKHPDFVSSITDLGPSDPYPQVVRFREINDSQKGDAVTVLYEELFEFLDAYVQGDLDHAIQELEQCGAVVLRMIEHVKKMKGDK